MSSFIITRIMELEKERGRDMMRSLIGFSLYINKCNKVSGNGNLMKFLYNERRSRCCGYRLHRHTVNHAIENEFSQYLQVNHVIENEFSEYFSRCSEIKSKI